MENCARQRANAIAESFTLIGSTSLPKIHEIAEPRRTRAGPIGFEANATDSSNDSGTITSGGRILTARQIRPSLPIVRNQLCCSAFSRSSLHGDGRVLRITLQAELWNIQTFEFYFRSYPHTLDLIH